MRFDNPSHFNILRIACQFFSGKVLICLLLVGLTSVPKKTDFEVVDPYTVVPALLGFFYTNIVFLPFWTVLIKFLLSQLK